MGLASYPGAISHCYVAIMLPLLVARYVIYREAKWHYFLIDFCYFVQLMLLLEILVWPDSAVLRQINFVFANGPLIWAVLVWRNGFVLGSFDKMTSVGIHLLPSVVMLARHWLAPSAALASRAPMTLLDLGWPLLAYSAWQLAYLVKVELLDRAEFERDPELSSSLRWFANKPGVLGLAVLRGLRAVGVMGPTEHYQAGSLKTLAVFVVTQLVYTVLTMLPTPWLWSSFGANVALLAAMLVVCAFNGATYYAQVTMKDMPAE